MTFPFDASEDSKKYWTRLVEATEGQTHAQAMDNIPGIRANLDRAPGWSDAWPAASSDTTGIATASRAAISAVGGWDRYNRLRARLATRMSAAMHAVGHSAGSQGVQIDVSPDAQPASVLAAQAEGFTEGLGTGLGDLKNLAERIERALPWVAAGLVGLAAIYALSFLPRVSR